MYNVIISELFCVIYNCVTITMTCDRCVTFIYDITLIPNSKTKIRKLNENENENKKRNKNKNRVHYI